MELQSKKLSKELKDLDDINDADLDSSEIPEIKALSNREVGKFYPSEEDALKNKDIN